MTRPTKNYQQNTEYLQCQELLCCHTVKETREELQ